MSRFAVIIIAASLFIGLSGCKSNGDKNANTVSPSLVTNPISADGKKNSGTLPVMTFEQTKHDLGMMIQGEKLAYTFKFTNTGGTDLIVSNCAVTCGCTVAEWPKAPVKPGESAKIEVVFNSAGKSGSQVKTIQVLANTQPNTTELTITAEVYVPESKK
jgi:hypothetical protein